MVHGNVLIENKTKQSLDTPNRVGNFRVSTLSPLKDRISKESTSRLKSPGFEPRNELQSIPVQSNASFIKVCKNFFFYLIHAVYGIQVSKTIPV